MNLVTSSKAARVPSPLCSTLVLKISSSNCASSSVYCLHLTTGLLSSISGFLIKSVVVTSTVFSSNPCGITCIVVVPFPTPVTTPFASTLATFSSSDL